MADYHTFMSGRPTEPDFAALTANLKALDVTAGVQHDAGTPMYVVKKSTPWTAAQITAAQNAIETAPEASPQRTAQAIIDNMPILEKAIILTLLDETNRLRAALRGSGVTGLPNIDTQTMIGAVRTKAGSL